MLRKVINEGDRKSESGIEWIVRSQDWEVQEWKQLSLGPDSCCLLGSFFCIFESVVFTLEHRHCSEAEVASPLCVLVSPGAPIAPGIHISFPTVWSL